MQYPNNTMPRIRTKTATMTVRVTDECKQLIERLAESGGVSQASVIERSVRLLAKAEGMGQGVRIPLPGGGAIISGGIAEPTDRPTDEPRADVAGNIAEAKDE